MVGIYCFTNMINNKQYVGQSIRIKKRRKEHYYDHANPENSSYNAKFYQALRKYGWEAFEFGVLEECSKEELPQKEKYWIEELDTYRNGYNSTLGGEDTSPMHTADVNKKRRDTIAKNQSFVGENHPRAKLTNSEVVQIRERYVAGESIEEMYEGYNTLYTLLGFRNMVLYSYKGVAKIPPEDIRKTGAKLTGREVRSIRERAKQGEDPSLIFLDFKDKTTAFNIRSIIKGTAYKHCGNL